MFLASEKAGQRPAFFHFGRRGAWLQAEGATVLA
jgi:hypothetical protein